MTRFPTKKLLITSTLTIFLLQAVGCGYLLYPERKGQRTGQIDPSVAIMDGLGLLLWIVPGVVAFAVDFTNGTIYLPGGHKGADANGVPDVTIQVANKEDLKDRAKLEALISKQLGKDVDLDASNVKVERFDEGTDAVKLVQYAQWQATSGQYAVR